MDIASFPSLSTNLYLTSDKNCEKNGIIKNIVNTFEKSWGHPSG